MYLVRSCETRVLKENIIQKLSVFERKILLGQLREPTLFGNKEMDELVTHWIIINYVKAQRLSWFGEINRMPETHILKRIHSQEDQLEGPSLDGKMMSGMI